MKEGGIHKLIYVVLFFAMTQNIEEKILLIKRLSMNKLNMYLICIFTFLHVTYIQAQHSEKDFFVGKWDVMVYGTSKGDQRMIIELNRVNGKLVGAIVGPSDDVKKFNKIEETANSVKLYFRQFLFTVELALDKKDDTHVIGKLHKKFKATGVKIK